MEDLKTLCQCINKYSLGELYMENQTFVTKGRACFVDDRVYFKFFEPNLDLEVGDVFVLRLCSLYVFVQLVSFIDSVGEFLPLKAGNLPKDKRLINPLKDALIVFENSIHKDKWGTLLVEEPYFLARVIDIKKNGAKIITSIDKGQNEEFYLALELDLFESLIRCKVVTRTAVDEYAEDFVYEVKFFDVSDEMNDILDIMQEGHKASEKEAI